MCTALAKHFFLFCVCFPQHLLDSCVKESDYDTNSPEFYVNHTQRKHRLTMEELFKHFLLFFFQIKYDFTWLQVPTETKDESRMKYAGPLASLNAREKFCICSFTQLQLQHISTTNNFSPYRQWSNIIASNSSTIPCARNTQQ